MSRVFIPRRLCQWEVLQALDFHHSESKSAIDAATRAGSIGACVAADCGKLPALHSTLQVEHAFNANERMVYRL